MNGIHLTVVFGFVFPGDEQGVQKFIKNLGYINTAINKQACRIFLSFGHQKDTHSPISSIIYSNIWYQPKTLEVAKLGAFIYLFILTFVANN